jgi:hypothetical protein
MMRSALGSFAGNNSRSTHRAVYQTPRCQPICTSHGQIRSGGVSIVMACVVVAIGSRAAEERRLHESQAEVTKAAGILVRGLARTGIVALVDEATGYQDVRAKDALNLVPDWRGECIRVVGEG